MIFKYRHKEPTKPTGGNEKSPLLLLLHGRGADENDLFGLAPYLDERFFVVSPRAPIVMPFGGYEWFELIIGNGGGISVNVQHFLKSREQISEFINELVAEYDLDAERIYLCGFSQGAIMSLSAALSEPAKFAGVVAMSGRAMPEMLPDEKDSDALEDFPMLVTHGIYDPVLPIEHGRASKEILSRLPVDLEYKEYEMAHEISPESLRDVSNWLRLKLDN